MKKNLILAALCVAVLLVAGCSSKKKEDTVKIGLLHSLTGTMAISEVPVRDSELLAIKEINEAGGVLGKQIEAVQADGESDPNTFAEKARKLLEDDKVVSVFGCWTSASRKAVKPVFEELFGLLWYPIQYEGMEASPNIMYMGAAPNQQIVPAIDYCFENFGKRMYLIGSDYVFPQTANRIIRAQLKFLGGTVVGEKYVDMEEEDFTEVIQDIIKQKPDVIINTVNGESNVAFFEQLHEAGITPSDIPVMNFSVGESEIDGIGVENIAGDYMAWTYFEEMDSNKNRRFVSNYKEEFGSRTRLGDPVEAGYIAVYMWAAACKKAGSFDTEAVRIAAKGLNFVAPEGIVTIEGSNQHLNKKVRIGRVKDDGLVEEVWSSTGLVRPDPYLSTYAWARGL